MRNLAVALITVGPLVAHPHIKDQILGHAVDDMIRLYTQVPQVSLIEAITLPVIQAWRAAPWMKDPLGWTSRRIEVVQKFAREKTA